MTANSCVGSAPAALRRTENFEIIPEGSVLGAAAGKRCIEKKDKETGRQTPYFRLGAGFLQKCAKCAASGVRSVLMLEKNCGSKLRRWNARSCSRRDISSAAAEVQMGPAF